MLRLLSIFFSVICLCCGCATRTSDSRATLAVSIEPLRYVVEAVAGDKFQVLTIMPRGASPETYEPTPRQMANLSSVGIVFRAGSLGFEQTKLPALLQTMPDVQLIDLGVGIAPLSQGEHSHGGESSIDPHTWMSPANLIVMARNACAVLCRADSTNAAYFRSRLATFEKKMQQLDSHIRSELLHGSQQAFLIYHPALGYYAHQYHLQQLAVEHDGKDPSAAYLQHLVERGRSLNISTVFISQEHSGTAARRLADEMQAHVVEINPLHYDVPAQLLLITQSLKNGR